MTSLKRGTQPILLTAIGRPVDPAWKEHFADVARSILPPTVELNMRKLPGIVYVPGGNLPGNRGLETRDEDVRQLRLREYAIARVVSLSDQGDLNQETAMSGIELPLHKPKTIGLKHPRASNVAVVVELDDILSSSGEGYPHQIATERDAFLDKFRINEVEVSARQLPKYHLAIGRLTGFASPENLGEIGEALQGPVPLLGIDGLNLDLES